MEIGVPKETKDQEYRVGLSPASVRGLTEQGHTRLWWSLWQGQGQDSVMRTIFRRGPSWSRQLRVPGIVNWWFKVKEPLAEEYGHLQAGQILFHLPALGSEPGL